MSAEARPVHQPGAWTGFRTALRLGWAVEANWTDPLLFVIYALAKPLSAALILVLIFTVITGGERPEYLSFLIIGAAFWNLVQGSMAGLVSGVLDDRERYRMLSYVYVTPVPFLSVLIGRATARFAVTVTGGLITLAVAILFLGLRIDPAEVRWPMLATALLLGLPAITGLGVTMAGLVLQMRHDSWSYPEAVAGALYLLSGAIFPIDVLPAFLQPIALALPLTWWLEAVRRALLGVGAPGRMEGFSDATVLLVLLVASAAAAALAWLVFRLLERRARDRGLIDNSTGS